jgi:methanol metabolism-related c-type cytochrome
VQGFNVRKLISVGYPIDLSFLIRTRRLIALALLTAVLGFGAFGVDAALADGSGDPKAVKNEDGKWFDKDGNPTFKVEADGTVDWYTYSGFRRYHSECHVCHGPDGEGSSYAPPIRESLSRLSYSDVMGVTASGRKNLGAGQEKVMPAFGDNRNVMCYFDDIFVYLRARANEAIPRGRPAKRADKPPEAEKAEKSCTGL